MAYQQQLSAERLWHVLFTPEVAYGSHEIPVIASLCYYTTTMIVGRLMRSVNKSITPSHYQSYLDDMIVTFQVCACSLENVMLKNSYGMGGYALILFALSAWFALTVKDGYGNPCRNIIDYVKGAQGAKKTALRCILQMGAALLSFRYARTFWMMGLTAGHGRRFNRLHCTAGLTVLSPVGFGIEFGATFIESLLSIFTMTPFYICETLSKSIIGTVMTCLGVHLTGMYLNPANAFTQEFGCRGVSVLEHIAVYWGGPLIAAALATGLTRHLRELLKTIPTRDVPIKSRIPVKMDGKKPDNNNQDSPARKSSTKNRFYQKRKEGSPKKGMLRKNTKKAN